MANYQQYGYPQPPYNQAAYPPQAYGQQHYAQPPYGQNQYAQVPYGQPGYPPFDPNFPQYHEGYPSKKQKNNSGNKYQQHGYPVAQQQHGYPTPSHYPPQSGYQQAAIIPPPPPPGWIPPPPPNWRGPVQHAPQVYPPAPNYQYPQAYPPAAHYPQHQPYPPSHNPYNQYPTQNHQQENSPNHHNHGQHFTQPHNRPIPRSRVWIRPPDTAATQKSVVPPATPSFNGQVVQPPSSIPTVSASTPAITSASVAFPTAKKTFNKTNAKAKKQAQLDASDWEWDDYWYGKDEKINPDLSLGEIEWHPANPTGRAIPANWDDAEQWCESPPEPFDKDSGETVSRYASADDVERACRSTKETREWLEVKDDPVFVEFRSESEMISISRAIANRNHISSSPEVPMDIEEEEGEITNSNAKYNWNLIDTLQSALRHDSQDAVKKASHAAEPVIIDGNKVESVSHARLVSNEEEEDAYSPPPVDHSVVETIESKILTMEEQQPEAVSNPVKVEKFTGKEQQITESIPEANSSPTVQIKMESKPFDIPGGHKLPPKPEIIVGYNVKKSVPKKSGSPERKLVARQLKLPPKPAVDFIKDDAQEDILARLGVTGAPKPAVGVPGPAYNPAPVVDNTAAAIQSMIVTSFPVPPPPPPPQGPTQRSPQPDVDDNPWGSGFDGSRFSPRSETSQHTLAGSDFHIAASVDNSPKLEIVDVATLADAEFESKKRTRGEPEDETASKRPKDDISSRLRTRRPKVAAAYSRRW